MSPQNGSVGKDRHKMAKITRDLHKLLELKHPYIVEFYDVKQIGSSVWSFMEFCPHQDLGHFFSQKTANRKTEIRHHDSDCTRS